MKNGIAKDACYTVLVRWPPSSFNWSGSRYRSWADHGVLGIIFLLKPQFEMQRRKKKGYLQQPVGLRCSCDGWAVCFAIVKL